MRFTPFIILGLLVGCSGAPDSGRGTGGGGEPDTGGDSYDYIRPSDNGGGYGCGNATEVIRSIGPDGQVIMIEVPIPCDPFYFDKGDPPPDDDEAIDEENVVDPGIGQRVNGVHPTGEFVR